jgi:hypothetical protein
MATGFRCKAGLDGQACELKTGQSDHRVHFWMQQLRAIAGGDRGLGMNRGLSALRIHHDMIGVIVRQCERFGLARASYGYQPESEADRKLQLERVIKETSPA